MTTVESAYPAAQQMVGARCAEAERLAAQAEQEAARLRDARRERAALERELHGGLALADRRALLDAKHAAQEEYQRQIERATDSGQVMAGAARWLDEIHRLNRLAATAGGRAQQIAAQLREADSQVSRLELNARAAAVAAATARQACLDARRALARADEALVTGPGAEQVEDDETLPLVAFSGQSTIEALLDGDRAVVAALAAQVAEATGLEGSRLQLLLLELREGVIERACASAMLDFPADHPFWSQFSTVEARAVAAALATLGRGFDGQRGWIGGRAAEPRELAIALSLAGRDPRTVKRRPTREELDRLWEGTTVAAVEHLRARAPELGLDSIVALLGERAEALAALWDNWGRMRRVLLDASS